MASTLVQQYMHIVFHTKCTAITMREKDLPRVFDYIGGVIRNINGVSIQVGGRPDHIHILASMPKTMSLAEFVRTVKSNSSKWIKTLDRYYEPFMWQEGYGAFSVSASVLDKTAKYIKNQKARHRERSFVDEYKQFLDAYHVEYDERYAFGD